jgi:hypothetical protein
MAGGTTTKTTRSGRRRSSTTGGGQRGGAASRADVAPPSGGGLVQRDQVPDVPGDRAPGCDDGKSAEVAGTAPVPPVVRHGSQSTGVRAARGSVPRTRPPRLPGALRWAQVVTAGRRREARRAGRGRRRGWRPRPRPRPGGAAGCPAQGWRGCGTPRRARLGRARGGRGAGRSRRSAGGRPRWCRSAGG